MKVFQKLWFKVVLIISIFALILAVYFTIMTKVNNVYQESKSLDIQYLSLSDKYEKFYTIDGESGELNTSAILVKGKSEIYTYMHKDIPQLRISVSESLLEDKLFREDFKEWYKALINDVKIAKSNSEIALVANKHVILFLEITKKY